MPPSTTNDNMKKLAFSALMTFAFAVAVAQSKAETEVWKNVEALTKTVFETKDSAALDALVAADAKLPKIALAPPENRSVIGRTTEAQMHIGVFWGYVAMMEGLVARIRAEIGRPAKVISTGGLAVLFDENSDIFDAIAPDLTILGLALLHERSLKN